MSVQLPASLPILLLWSLLATVAMTSVLYGSQGLGLSRMSLPFLVGTFFTGNRSKATVIGFVLYVIGGSLFALLYFLLFESVKIYTWWFGALAGVLHGLFLLVCALPLLPYVHPRMASDYHGVTQRRQLEPPGFLGMNYGFRTPLTTLLGQLVYGLTLGAFVQLYHASGGSG